MSKFSVAYCLDEKYLIPFCCSLSSLLDHNNHLVDEVFLLHDEQSANSSQFRQTKKFIQAKYEKKITDFVIEPSIFRELRADHHISHATYFRFLIADKLPSDVETVLSIDCDTIVKKELDLFYTINFENESNLFAYAVDHEFHETPPILNKYYSSLKTYFNAGVLFMNLNKIRSELDSQSLIKFGVDNGVDLKFWDQDILNIHFRNNWGRLPAEYNVFESHSHKISNPAIIHYTGNRKPWRLICDHPFRNEYWRQLKKTPLHTLRFRLIERLGTMLTGVLRPFIKTND